MTSTREDDRQYFKKQTNYYYNHYNNNYNNYNRKNSIGTIAPYSNSTINSNSFAAAATVTGPALPSLKQALEHTPVNNFNSREVSNFLNNTWNETLDQYYDNNIPESEKPELHKSTWARGGFVWGQRGHLMANGNDFFAELKKSSLS